MSEAGLGFSQRVTNVKKALETLIRDAIGACSYLQNVNFLDMVATDMSTIDNEKVCFDILRQYFFVDKA